MHKVIGHFAHNALEQVGWLRNDGELLALTHTGRDSVPVYVVRDPQGRTS